MSTTVQSCALTVLPESGNPERSYVTAPERAAQAPAQEADHNQIVMDAVCAIERAFRSGAAKALAEGTTPAAVSRPDLELMQTWLGELYDRYTNPERVLEDLAAENDIDVHETTSPALTRAILIPEQQVLIVPATLEPAVALEQLRAALAQQGQQA
ncbi:hypothetical protein [Streptomyces sp. NPDC088736]|uniref:hypothetical protein n=1 Tax=Streptomyces sp. NPDC088736 TaxID=3365881 RepID=UPI0038086D37